jgi:hypothetical protein
VLRHVDATVFAALKLRKLVKTLAEFVIERIDVFVLRLVAGRFEINTLEAIVTAPVFGLQVSIVG